MRMQSIVAIVLALTLAAPVAAAAQTAPDVTGTWTGKFTFERDGKPGEEGAHVVLAQKGADVTGTAGPTAERQFPISNGKIETTKAGTTLTFDTGRQGSYTHFDLKLVNGKLTGIVTDEGRKLTLELARAK
jgi:hypothetical protein